MKANKFLQLTLLAILLWGCSRYGNELQYIKYGKVEVYVTDAPFPHDLISEANVTIVKIEARLKAFTDDSMGYVILFEGNQRVNLMELNNGVTHFMGATEAPLGAYDQVRIYVNQADILLVDGSSFELATPSAAQSGIKAHIFPELEVTGNLTSELLLDFDLSKSFVLKGNVNTPAGIKGFGFKPVVKVSNMTETGSISGKVQTLTNNIMTGIEGAQVGVMVADTVYTTSFTDASGAYSIIGISSGNYTFTAEKSGYKAEVVQDVKVTPGNDTEQNFILIQE